MRSLTLPLLALLASNTLCHACLNDRSVVAAEQEFRSSYSTTQPAAPGSAHLEPIALGATVLGSGTIGAFITAGAIRRRHRGV